MDQVDLLRNEAKSPHAVFHQFILTQSKSANDARFLFFEGEDDPVFYIGQILPYLCNREYHEFVCNGRDGVIKLHDLCARDGRSTDRTLFFIDKDHSDILSPQATLPTCFFQTECYSFENYIVCESVFRRFWVERLHLQSTDARYANWLKRFKGLSCSFASRMRLLMAIVLIGRGVDGRSTVKLNLNNVKLEKVISIDFKAERVRWLPRGGHNFFAASNLRDSSIFVRGDEIRHVYRKFLREKNPKCYIRGKYELWFFVQFLSMLSRTLGDKAAANATGLQRAKPSEIICFANCLNSLSALTPCPAELTAFLAECLPPASTN